jgi:hypothetical protein
MVLIVVLVPFLLPEEAVALLVVTIFQVVPTLRVKQQVAQVVAVMEPTQVAQVAVLVVVLLLVEHQVVLVEEEFKEVLV